MSSADYRSTAACQWLHHELGVQSSDVPSIRRNPEAIYLSTSLAWEARGQISSWISRSSPDVIDACRLMTGGYGPVAVT